MEKGTKIIIFARIAVMGIGGEGRYRVRDLVRSQPLRVSTYENNSQSKSYFRKVSCSYAHVIY